MAEAHSAVAELRIDDLEEGRDTAKDFIRAWRRSFLRRFFRTRNLIRNGMWPTSIWNLGITTSIFSIFLINNWEWARPINRRLLYIGSLMYLHEGLPFFLRVIFISFVGGVVFFIILMYVRRWLLRILLSYRGWMYQAPRTQSISTFIWGLIVKLVSGYAPTMYSYQKSLPFLPVPKLQVTLTKFLASIKPLYGENSAEFQKLKSQSKEFEKGIGPKLQRILVLKSWWSQNWVTDWWEKYVYLMGRSPIAINSNYYVLDESHWKPTGSQVSRAASVVYQFCVFKRSIDREQVPPLLIRNTIPLCMAQYDRIFSSTRIPGEDVDHLVKYSTAVSKHLVVMRKGLYYQLDMFDKAGNPLLPQTLEKQLQWICDDADKHADKCCSTEKALSALTGLERTDWAKIRACHFQGINKESLDIMEKAIFHVVLEERSFDTWSQRGKFLMHGDGQTIWYDKSFTVVVFQDGRYGLNCEHSWGDAPIMAHLSEFNMTKEVIEGLFEPDGSCKHVDAPQVAVRTPVRILWDLPEDLKPKIESAIAVNVKNNEDLDLVVSEHRAYGKGFIKKCKVSPDAFVQLAIQLAYYKDADKFALTYEASMTRLYLLGRTETVRSLTSETEDFILAMTDKTRTREECIQLLRIAGERHQKLYRDAMNGMGIDRHMFGLYVVCRGLGYESEFLKNALMMPWTLSTSQQPQQQIAESPNCSLPQYMDKVCPGGGFGPVSDYGYGVSYMIPGEYRIFFHVSSKKSSHNTNSQRFMNLLFESLEEMKLLFEDPVCQNGTEQHPNKASCHEPKCHKREGNGAT